MYACTYVCLFVHVFLITLLVANKRGKNIFVCFSMYVRMFVCACVFGQSVGSQAREVLYMCGQITEWKGAFGCN